MSFKLFVVLCIGFSIGASLLLALAFGSVYRAIALPLQSRLAGYVMLLSLAVTQVFHARVILGLEGELATPSYSLGLVLQSVGFYWLLLGLLRPQSQRWQPWEWAVLPAAASLALLLPATMVIPLAMLGASCITAHLGYLLFKLRAQRRWLILIR
jgi:hypothetical protein